MNRAIRHSFLLLAIGLSAFAARAQTAGLTGVYDGKYTCGQGPTYLKLSVVLSPIGDVSALFTFYLPADQPTQGYSYSLHGQLDPQTNSFSLTPVRWETEHGANLGMVGMDGALSGDRLSGRITGGRCTTFDLTRNKNESAMITAVIAAQKNGGKPITPSTWSAQLATAQAAAPAPAVGTTGAQPGTPPAPAMSQDRPAPTVVPSAPSKPSQEVAGAEIAGAQRPAQPTPAEGEESLADLDDDSFDRARMIKTITDPVLYWKVEDSAGASPQPVASSFFEVNDRLYGLAAKVGCSDNGISVIFNTFAGTNDTPFDFVWYEDDYGDTVSDVQVTVDGRGHTAKGFPNIEGDKLYVNTLGLFFYKPGLAEDAVRSKELEARTGTALDSVIGPLARAAAEAEVNDAQATSGGPLTDLMNAESIRVQFSLQHSATKLFADINPQHPALHKFVTDCAAKLGLGPAAAKPAPQQSKAPAALER
jgi:hypothetical protein